MLVVDDHSFRGSSIVALLSARGFETTLCDLSMKTCEGTIPTPGEAEKLIIYIVGDASLVQPGSRAIASQILERSPDVPLVIVADEVSRADIEAAVAMGVRGIISTRMSADVAIAALRLILAGGHYFPHSVFDPAPEMEWVARRLTAHAGAGDPDLPQGASVTTQLSAREEGGLLKFSARQAEVVGGLERGLSNKAIAQELELCEATVKIHVRQVMRKLGVCNRTQVALWATTARTTQTVGA